jgi:cytochrome c oxidase cbb3-type subunit 1
MTTFTPAADSTDTVPADTASRCPLLLLLGSGLAWLLVSGVFALINALQLDSASFLAGCRLLTYGHIHALAETTFVYGWLGNAGLALSIWILGRLGGEALRATPWMSAGGLFWNLGVLIGVIGIAAGDATSYPLLQLPRYAQPLLLVSYGAVAISGVLAWTGRRRRVMYAAQWYAVAPLFFFPWLFSVAQVLLLWSPVRGTLQAVVQGWYAQGLWTLWAAPLALAGAYYVLPRANGKTLPAYDLAWLGFWALLFVGGWTGGRHLIGGPVPAWIPTVAIVAATLLLSHYLIVFLNLRGVFAGGSLAVRFIGFGLGAYFLGGIFDAITAMRVVAVATEFTYCDEAMRQLAYYGAASMILYGVLYFALPRVSGRPWASAALARGHFALAAIGLALLVFSLAMAGVIQGRELNDAQVSFASIAAHTHPWLLLATAAQALLLLGNLLLAVNFTTSACSSCCSATSREALAS